MRVDHVGLVVANVQAGRRHLETFYHATPRGEPIDDPLQQATVWFFDAHGVTIELIAPLGADSHLHNVLERSGEHLAHLCYEVDDLDAALAEMRGNKAMTISRKPAVAFGGRDVAFVLLPNKTIVELLAASRRDGD
ncbi:MAG: VOC family protein [Planctomycetota bacterium]